MIKVSKEKVSRKKRPTVYLKGDNRIAQVPSSHINGKVSDFEFSFRRETGLTPINSVKDLAERLKEFNKSLDDTTIVYCRSPEDTKESHHAAIRLMRQESRNPLLVADPEIGKELRMEPGKFYVYYKPSFINGFEQYMEKDINFNFLQAFEGVCRDDFTLNPTYVESEEFKNLLSQTGGIQTE